MDTKMIAKILPTKDDGKRTIGTGYPIGNNLVLTARHVVDFPERNANFAISVEWPNLNYTSEVTEIIYIDDKIDIAIIRCATPPGITIPPNLLARNFPEEHENWDSYGYPNIGKDEKTGLREKIPAMGKFFRPDEVSHKLSLTSESDALEKAGWCGLSGAPVFKNNTLYAVIIETPTQRMACFSAVSVPWLIKNNAEFRQAIRMDNNAEAYRKFEKQQQRQIQELLESIPEDGKLVKELALKLKLPLATVNPQKLSEKLFAEFALDNLVLLQDLLEVSADVLKQDNSEAMRENVQILFCLFASLMAPRNTAIKQALINLAVYTPLAIELSLAPIYDTNPDIVQGYDGELKGKYAIEASVLARETGWDSETFKIEAAAVLYTEIHKKPSPKPLVKFERSKLNATIKQRQNRSLNQLHRIELNLADKTLVDNPLRDETNIHALNADDCLPDLPIVHYGETIADQEAELSAKLGDLFEILKRYGPKS